MGMGIEKWGVAFDVIDLTTSSEDELTFLGTSSLVLAKKESGDSSEASFDGEASDGGGSSSFDCGDNMSDAEYEVG